MASYESELARLRAEVAHSGQLKTHLNSLRRRREALAAEEEELRAIRIDEQDDVDRLEARSLARYFFSLAGSLDEKLDRERAEARAAAVKHDAAIRELEDVDADISAAEAELARLSGCEQRYDAAIERRAAELKASGSPLGARLRELESRMAALERSARETDEAIAAGRAAAEASSEVIGSLSSASTWSTFDVFSDSVLTDMMKYSRINDAQYAMERLRSALRRFGSELGDVGGRLDAGMGDFMGFADVFFDNIFTDLAVSSRISRSLAAAEDTHRRVMNALGRLEAMRRDCGAQLRRLSEEYDSLVAGS